MNPFKKLKDFLDKEKEEKKTVKNTKSAGQKSAKTAFQQGGSSTDMSGLFEKWSSLYSDSGSDANNQAILLLQKQIENYEKQIELRRQRLLNEMKPTVFAVTGAKKSATPGLKDTDDVLPYQPILLDINKVLADLRAKRAAQLAAKSGQPVHSVTASSSVAPMFVKKMPAGKVSVIKKSQKQKAAALMRPKDESKVSDGPSPTVQPRSTAVGAEVAGPPQTSVASDSKDDSSSSTSSSSSSSSSTSDSSSTSERLHDLNAILKDMIVEAEKPEAPKPKEPEKKLTGEELAAMSRNEPGKFDSLVTDHVKHSLFSCQPTLEELSNWESKRARVLKQKFDELSWNPKQPLEVRTFCVSCKPRYPQPLN